MKLRARLEPFPDGALGVRRKGFLDFVHLDTTRVVSRPPKQAVNKDLENKYATHDFTLESN